MPVVSPAIPIANSPAVRFDSFQSRSKVRIAYVLFSTAEGTPGTEIAKGLGTRDLTVTAFASIAEPDYVEGGYFNESLEFDFFNGSVIDQPGREFIEFDFVDSTTNAVVVAAPKTAAGALSYRIVLSVTTAKVTVI